MLLWRLELNHHSHIFICVKCMEKNIQVKSYRLGTTRGRVNNDKMYIFGWTTLLHFPFPSSLLFAGDGRGLMIMGSAQLWENTWYEERKSHIDFREREREREQQCFFCVLVKQTALGALRGATARLEMGPAVYDTSQTCRMCDRRCWWVEAPDNPV